MTESELKKGECVLYNAFLVFSLVRTERQKPSALSVEFTYWIYNQSYEIVLQIPVKGESLAVAISEAVEGGINGEKWV